MSLDSKSVVKRVRRGTALLDAGRAEEALAALNEAVAVAPDCAAAHGNRGLALARLRRVDEAIASYRRALELDPSSSEILTNLGVALAAVGRGDEAVAAHEKALALRPGLTVAMNNLGIALGQIGRYEEALARHEDVLRLAPEDAIAHFNRGIQLLTLGRFDPGWAEYEWRSKVEGLAAPRAFAVPRWDGSDPAGRRILLHAEQGLGDAMQFVRYAPLLTRRGAHVIVECDASLKRLFMASLPETAIVTRGEHLPDFDSHLPLPSLPYAFGATPESIPAEVPYLRPPPELASRWHARVASRTTSGVTNVGLIWAGNPRHHNDRNRSIPPGLLAPLAQVPMVQFFSLQKRSGAPTPAADPVRLPFIDWTNDLHDFADTAAVITNLDLVISVDTSVAHLAGAMGKPVWTLLPFVPDFRWMLGRADSPWYPTTRLFRQPSQGDWQSLVERVIDELKAAVTAGQPAG